MDGMIMEEIKRSPPRRTPSETFKRISALGDAVTDRDLNLTKEQIQDMGKIVDAAGHIASQYADKKEIAGILRDLLTVTTETADSIEEIDDEIEEMLLAMEISINRVRDAHARISHRTA